jgi:FKBP-type peptidyl-prolyl cis-trans isomerase FklB
MFLLAGCPAEKSTNPKGREEKISYAIGLDIGRDLLEQNIRLEQDVLLQGIRDGLSGSEPALPEEEIEAVRKDFLKEQKTRHEEERKQKIQTNQAEEEAFLAANGKKEGVVVLPSGLQYRIIDPGTGSQPSAEDNVKVHYRGYFVDETEFENTFKGEQPAVFPVRGVIPGWTEALQLMREGARWELYVPAALAYGEKGAGKKIGPAKMLIFEVELIGIH